MKKIIATIIFLMFLSTPLYAETWCTWSGTEGENCQSDNRGYLRDPVDKHPIGPPESNYNYHGFYKRTSTYPALGINQVRDAEVWDLVGNQMSLTWTVRDMTATEIDEEIANPMSITDYYQWKTLLVTGLITQQQAANNLPQEMIDAYQARKRLLGD